VTIEKTLRSGWKGYCHDDVWLAKPNDLDFACAGGDAFLALLALNKIKHTSLAVGQHLNE